MDDYCGICANQRCDAYPQLHNDGSGAHHE